MCIPQRLVSLSGGTDQPKIGVIGEGADEDTVPRGNRIFNRVIHELAGLDRFMCSTYSPRNVTCAPCLRTLQSPDARRSQAVSSISAVMV
jgi:hypothetical protein